MHITDVLFALLGAWLFALIFKGKDLALLAKRDNQRTPEEKKKVKTGLVRALLIEFVLLVPASTTLILLITPAVLRVAATGVGAALQESTDLRRAFYVLVGAISYNFPFATVREIATRVALNTIEEFYLRQHRRDSERKTDNDPD
jgi:hypothetical protein